MVTLAMLVVILMPGDSVPSVGIKGLDKVMHCGMFFVQAGTFCFEYLRITKKLPSSMYTLIGLGIFGLATEVMQLFASKRSFDLKDLVADLVGIALAIVLWQSIEIAKRIKNKTNSKR